MTTGRAVAVYAAISLAILAVGCWIFGVVYPGPTARRAVYISAAISFVVQIVGFLAARYTRGTNPFAGWGMAMLLRFATLAIYGFLVVERLGLPSAAALLSLATFFFVSTLVEPPLLKP
ncbi:MAG: hypothetical protein ACYC2G_05580 [Gemmatimonadaceae bacterium]